MLTQRVISKTECVRFSQNKYGRTGQIMLLMGYGNKREDR